MDPNGSVDTGDPLLNTTRGQRGFTLVELMITMLLAAILMAMAVPGFRAMTQNSQQRNAVNDLQTMLARIRTEVASRRVPVTACPSADQASCSGAVTWEAGWIVFADLNSDGVVDAGENVILVHEALPAGTTLRSFEANATTRLRFGRTGLPASAVGASFRYCDRRGVESLRTIVVGPSGMIRFDRDNKDHTGVAIGACT
jgi:type IV fimbrial biogenesis protein FimT